MNESKIDPDITSVASPWKVLRQGDIIEIPDVLKATSLDQIAGESSGSVVVISQTCDIVLDSRPNIAVARLVRLTGSAAREALAGMQPRYVHLPNIVDEPHFADLEYMTSVSKEAVGSSKKIESGVNPDDDMEVRQFSHRVARRFGRFPFPDDVAPWLEPLKKVARDKHDKPDSALGRLFREITELRIESANWRIRPADLTLHVIVKAGTLPEIDYEASGDVSPGVSRWLDEKDRLPAEIAERLYPGGREPASIPPMDRQALWMAFADALARQCSPKGRYLHDESVASAVQSISGLTSSDDEFSLAQYRRSELLDLDHLSLPAPLSDV